MYLKVLTDSDASKLSELINDGDWMVLYYAEWCGHCKTMKPEWDKVVQKLKESGNVNVADVKSDVIPKLEHKPDIEGFPTIKMYNNGKSVARFQDERSADNLVKFAMSNSNISGPKQSIKNNTAIRTSIQNMLAKLSTTNVKPEPEPEKAVVYPTKSLNIKKTNAIARRLTMQELKNEIFRNNRTSQNNQRQKEMLIKLEDNAPAQPNSVPSPIVSVKPKKTYPILELTMEDLQEPPKAINNTKKRTQREKPKKKKKLSKKALPPPAQVVQSPAPIPPPVPVVQSPAPIPPPVPVVQSPAPIPPHVPAPQLANLACADIRRAKPCKANRKCEFDYTKSKCKDKDKVSMTKHSKNKSAKASARARSEKKKTLNKGNQNTKQIFQELIKSFNTIGNETKKDSKLLKHVRKRI